MALAESGGNERISLSPGPFRFAYNQWLQDWEIWAVRGLVDELIVQNYAYSLKGFQNDLGQSAIHRAQSWGIPVHIGILAGFGGRTTPMTKLHRKLQLAHQHGFGAVYFYWEGLWGEHAGPEGGDFRRQGLRRRHAELFGEQIVPF